jgi:hypothetical protein
MSRGGPKGSRSREARRGTSPRTSPVTRHAHARTSLQGLPLLLSASGLVTRCLPLDVHPPPDADACASLPGLSAPSGLLLSRSPLPPRCCQRLGPIPSWASPPPRCLPRSLAPRLRASRPLMALAPLALLPDWACPPTSLTCSVSPLRGVDPAPLSAESTAVVFPAFRFRVPLDLRSRCRPPPRFTTSLVARPSVSKLMVPCSLQGLPLRPHASGSSPVAPLMAFSPPSGCALSQSPLPHTEVWARSPPGHSPRLRGSGVPGCRCLSAPLRSWPLFPLAP